MSTLQEGPIQPFDLRRAVGAYLSVYPGDERALRALGHLDRQPLCFHNQCFDDGHVTGSAWVASPDRERVLLTHHRKLGIWVQLGGHSDGQPNTLAVALREAQEESGLEFHLPTHQILDIDVHQVPARTGEPSHFHYDIRFAMVAKSLDFTVGEESIELRWLRVSDIEQASTEASLLRMRDKWLLNRNAPDRQSSPRCVSKRIPQKTSLFGPKRTR